LLDKQKIRSPKEQCLGSRTITISSLANSNIAKDGRCRVLDIPRTGQFTDQASSAAYENPAIVAGLRERVRSEAAQVGEAAAHVRFAPIPDMSMRSRRTPPALLFFSRPGKRRKVVRALTQRQ